MSLEPRRVAPTLVAAALAAAYVVISPPSVDLWAHLYRAHLFDVGGFGIWDNGWYAGHHTPGYSVLFPPASGLLTPRLAAAIAAVGTAALFESLVRRRFGPQAWLGASLFGAATAVNLYTGRLTFAFGGLPAMAAVLALERRRTGAASALAVLAALCAPVAALFVAVFAAGDALGSAVAERRPGAGGPGVAVAVAALAPIAALALVFPEGGTEPFAFSSLWPIPLLAIGGLVALPANAWRLRAGVALYAAGTVVAYAIPSPIGSNAARLGTLLALPLAALLWWRRRVLWLAVAAAPLLYLQWQAPVNDVLATSGEPSATAAYYAPLLQFLSRRPGPPFRIEIPFTRVHAEAYYVATHVPLARGWERQLDVRDNSLFYRTVLSADDYRSWLHRTAVRYVALPDAPLDYSAIAEARLIRSGLPFLKLVARLHHWQVYAVSHPTPIVGGAATLTALGAHSLSLSAGRGGSAIVRVGFTPYWSLTGGVGCVSRSGDFTKLTFRRGGTLHLVTSFALGRVDATSPRCNRGGRHR
jgi:hypothetical protein